MRQTLEKFCCGDCSIKVTAILGYLALVIPVFYFPEMSELILMYGVTLASLISSALCIQQVQC